MGIKRIGALMVNENRIYLLFYCREIMPANKRLIAQVLNAGITGYQYCAELPWLNATPRH